MTNTLNLYGDQLTVLSANKGADIATQRADDLDEASVAFARAHPGAPALDVGCGAGGQTLRLLQAGAAVLGLDFPQLRQAFEEHTQGKAQFVGMSMDVMDKEFLSSNAQRFSQITCQRAIHYLPRAQALQVLQNMRSLLNKSGSLFISCSGMNSELGINYAGARFEAHERFDVLASDMQEKHSIKQPVCLYTQEEFAQLLQEAGFRIVKIYSSAFGNIKTIATPL